MTTVIGVRFKKAGKVYYFDPSDVWPNPGDSVIVETSRGIELGEVITGAREIDGDRIVAPLKKVLRLASREDVERFAVNQAQEADAFAICQERIAKHGLEMKLIDVEYTFDGSKIVFYFTADGRVDFRELVKDLAATFKMRIELRQIGVRDEAKMLGGLGPCGRPICCGAFLSDFQPVSIKMAKEQNLSLNPTKISGQCGRLMCCLSYEKDIYEETLKKLPRVGKLCMTPDGGGVITDINVIRQKVRVRVHSSDDSYEIREYPVDEITRPDPNQLPARPQEKPRPVPEEQEKPAEEAKDEKPRKKRLTFARGSKQVNTDQYFENLKAKRGESDQGDTAPQDPQ